MSEIHCLSRGTRNSNKVLRQAKPQISLRIRSVSARPEFLGVIDDPLFENVGVIGKFRGSELFLMYNYFLSEHASILKVFEECPLS